MLSVSFAACGGTNEEDLNTLNAIAFQNKTVTYNGLEHSLSADDLPSGVQVSYQGNGKVNAGEYSVKAIFSLNGQSVEKTATLTIEKALLTVKASDALAYVGENVQYKPVIQGFVNGETEEVLTQLPTFFNQKTQAGNYEDYIVFSGGVADNYDFVYQSADLKLLPLYQEVNEGGVTFIEFGAYPQTVVSDITLLADLVQAYDEDLLDDRGYFTYDGEMYYKACASVMTDVDELIENQMVFTNGDPIVDCKEYFFKVEPIRWRVLSEKNGAYMLMSELLIDTVAYHSDPETVKGENDEEIYASNWEHSDMRAWLNDGFSKMAFAGVQTPFLVEEYTNNSAQTALYDRYANGNDTMDKVFLPSYVEVKDLCETVLLAKTTDYARAMGAYMLYGENGYWWTRSPGATGSPSGFYPSTTTRPSSHANVSVIAPNVMEGVVLDKYNQVKNEWTCIRPCINFVFAD